MLQRFIDYCNQQQLLPSGRQLLLAVSGGRDSVALAHLCHSAAIPFAIAHCNFHLRPGDCDRDEAFVRHLADDYGVPCHVAQFDTRAIAAATGESIEEAARRLRYEYFSSLVSQQPSYAAVATAHHRDDSIETFFLNLFRGTGIAGLHGIRPKTHSSVTIVRPMLCFSRADIDRYVEEYHLEYVDDHTNFELDARRNQIRLRLMPLLRELYPSIDATMAANIERLHDTELLYKEYIESLRTSLISPHPSRLPDLPFEILSVDLPQLVAHPSSLTILFELLHPFGFNAATVSDILAAKEDGKLFYSPTHVAERHRGRLLLAPKVDTPQPPSERGDDRERRSQTERGDDRERKSLYTSPLSEGGRGVKRPWRAGDRIRLKKGSRLLSDYLKDLGLSRIERQHVLVTVDPDGFVVLDF